MSLSSDFLPNSQLWQFDRETGRNSPNVIIVKFSIIDFFSFSSTHKKNLHDTRKFTFNKNTFQMISPLRVFSFSVFSVLDIDITAWYSDWQCFHYSEFLSISQSSFLQIIHKALFNFTRFDWRPAAKWMENFSRMPSSTSTGSFPIGSRHAVSPRRSTS